MQDLRYALRLLKRYCRPAARSATRVELIVGLRLD
jgi:hypothetical protein